MKKGDFERKNYHLYSQTPPNASKYTRDVTTTTQLLYITTNANLAYVGLFLGECGHFQGSGGMKKSDFELQNSHVCS